MVEGAALNSDERAWDICAGDRPRARSALILAAMDSNSSSVRFSPAPGGGQLAVGQQLGAGRGVLAAERHRAVVAAPVAAVADVRPAAEPGAGALGHRLDPRPLARPARDGAVAPDLVGDARLGTSPGRAPSRGPAGSCPAPALSRPSRRGRASCRASAFSGTSESPSARAAPLRRRCRGKHPELSRTRPAEF